MSTHRDRSPLRRDILLEIKNLENCSNLDELLKSEMANATEISMARDMLPEYSGGSKNLAYFIKQGEYYIELLKKPEEGCVFNKLLLEQIKSKLVGEARDVLISQNCTKWSELKDALLQRFGDPRSEELLLNDLTTCFQNHAENYDQYFEKIKSKLQVLIEHISIRTPNNDIKISKENMYTNQALATFKAGIVEPYCSYLMNLPIRTLEEALFECRRYDNNKSQISFMNFLRNRSKPIQKNNNNNNNNNQGRNNNYRHNFVPTNRSYFDSNSQRQFNNPQKDYFPRGPINIQPSRSSPPQHFPTHSQVFGKKHEQKPVPMSISTKNTYHNRSPQHSFRAQSKPNFISEELYNIENPVNSQNNNEKFEQDNLYHNDYELSFAEDRRENFHSEASEIIRT